MSKIIGSTPISRAIVIGKLPGSPGKASLISFICSILYSSVMKRYHGKLLISSCRFDFCRWSMNNINNLAGAAGGAKYKQEVIMLVDGKLIVFYDDLVDMLITQGHLKGKDFIPKSTEKHSHGSCCYCNDCRHLHDECVCGHNELLEQIKRIIRR